MTTLYTHVHRVVSLKGNHTHTRARTHTQPHIYEIVSLKRNYMHTSHVYRMVSLQWNHSRAHTHTHISRVYRVVSDIADTHTHHMCHVYRVDS